MKKVLCEDVFEISYGCNFTKVSDYTQGKIPVIKSSSLNNGVIGYFNITPEDDYVISVARTGSIGSSFFHNYPCYITDDCMRLRPKFQLSPKLMLLYATIIQENKNRFNYSRKITPNRLNKILVPSLEEAEELSKFISIPSQPSNKRFLNKEIKFSDRNWKWLSYSKIFTEIKIASSIDLNKLKKSINGINYIGRTREYNGVTNHISNKAESLKKVNKSNCITVAMVGDSTGSAFYQDEDFYASQNILVLRNELINKYSSLFINTIIGLEKYRFSYGRTLTLTNIRNSKIKLPVNSEGNPDWNFMEDYIKSLPYSKSIQ